LIIKGTR